MEADWRMEFDKRQCVKWVAHVHRSADGDNLIRPQIRSNSDGFRWAICECGADRILDRDCV